MWTLNLLVSQAALPPVALLPRHPAAQARLRLGHRIRRSPQLHLLTISNEETESHVRPAHNVYE